MLQYFPKSFVEGDSFTKIYDLEEYPANDGWVLHAVFQGAFNLHITSTQVGETAKHKLDVPTTSGLIVGEYQVIFYVFKTNQRNTLCISRLTVTPNPLSASTVTDFRTFEEQMLAAVEALIMRRATNSQLDLIRTNIDGKELERLGPIDLLMLRDKFKAKVSAQQGKNVKAMLFTFRGIGH